MCYHTIILRCYLRMNYPEEIYNCFYIDPGPPRILSVVSHKAKTTVSCNPYLVLKPSDMITHTCN